MSPGALVRIDDQWRYQYRKVGARTAGTLLELTPSGALARVRMDAVADSWVWTHHLVEDIGRVA